jgi:hypothetical protein
VPYVTAALPEHKYRRGFGSAGRMSYPGVHWSREQVAPPDGALVGLQLVRGVCRVANAMKCGLIILGDQGMEIDSEEGHERPEDNCRQSFQNIAGNVPCHKIAVGGGDHYADGKIRGPDQAYSAPA